MDVQTNLVEFLREEDMTAFFPSLVRLVAEGDPVPLARLADEAGGPEDRLAAWLHAQPGTDWDEQGRLLGFGLTQRETRHRFVVDGRELFTFCAADTLLFPPILGRSARVSSTCPATGQRIRVEVTPTGVTAVEPATAVVSHVRLRPGCGDIRAETCDHGYFFASDAAAEQWRRSHREGHVLQIAEFFTQGLAANRDLGWVAGDAADRDFDAGYRARLEWARPQIALMAALFRLTDVASRPAALREVAAVLGESVDEVRAKIDRYARKVTRIEDGLVRLQLSFPDRPARFRVEIGDRVLHTNAGGCAGDVFALVLWTGRPLRVEADCPATGRRIRVAVTPDRVTAVDPEDAVISVADPASAKFAGLDKDPASAKFAELDKDPASTVICRQQNFYTSAQAARSDPQLEPGARIFPVGQYLDWIRAIGVIDDPTP